MPSPSDLPPISRRSPADLQVELRLGVLPTDWLHASNGVDNRTRGCPPVLFRLVRVGVEVGVRVRVKASVLETGSLTLCR